eukprot:SAG31_NODE_2796_length_5081_cov_49.527499_4_plen_83_part_00
MAYGAELLLFLTPRCLRLYEERSFCSRPLANMDGLTLTPVAYLMLRTLRDEGGVLDDPGASIWQALSTFLREQNSQAGFLLV